MKNETKAGLAMGREEKFGDADASKTLTSREELLVRDAVLQAAKTMLDLIELPAIADEQRHYFEGRMNELLAVYEKIAGWPATDISDRLKAYVARKEGAR